eukprot:scaffold60057_cov20-Tisochrysis_lutea.AAC.2
MEKPPHAPTCPAQQPSPTGTHLPSSHAKSPHAKLTCPAHQVHHPALCTRAAHLTRLENGSTAVASVPGLPTSPILDL